MKSSWIIPSMMRSQPAFNKIIFVIRKDIEADFRERIGNRVEAICASLNVEIAYAFQDLSSIPIGHTVPSGRTKPWGTGQAVLAAKDLIHEPFAVINADDYYGKEAFRKLHDWLVLDHNDSAIAMAGFILKNTLSNNGGVTEVCARLRKGIPISPMWWRPAILSNRRGRYDWSRIQWSKIGSGLLCIHEFLGLPCERGT